MTRSWRGVGPGAVIAAAFIGPGTVTTATLAGARFGTTLLWALAFATLATIVLQEMSARLGLVTGAGLGQALRTTRGPRWLGILLATLATVAVISGAAAYQAGNLSGAALGLEAFTGLPLRAWIGIGAVAAGVLLWTGRYRWLERVLTACVAIMGVVFVTTAALVVPHLGALLRGTLVPSVPSGADFTVLALVGTTIVPYNLFLHAAAVRERWNSADDLPAVRADLVIAIAIGGIVSGAIVVTAAAALNGGTVESVSDMARQLTPILGGWASRAFALGFAAAGVSSAITAPLAAAYTLQDALGRGRDVRAPAPRAVWIACIAVGAAAALSGTQPVPLIFLAQVVNGIVLPLVAVVLLVAMNDRRRLGDHVNGWVANLTGAVVVILCTVLGIRAIVLAL